MRRFVFLLAALATVISTSIAFAPDLIDLEIEYDQKKDQIRHEYRVGLAKQLKMDTTKIEMILLQFDGHYEGDETYFNKSELFYVEATDTSAPILKSVGLDNSEDAKALKAELVAILEKQNPGRGAMCHTPVHGIRITLDEKSKKKIEMSFCWDCHNIGFSYPDGTDYLGTTEGLKAAFEKIVPIPQSELDRFKDRDKWIPSKELDPEDDFSE